MQAAAAPTRWNPGTCVAAVALLHWVAGFCGDAGAQEGGGEAGEAGELEPIALQQLSYSLAGWTVDDGLPGNRVDAIAQTPDGYLWVGTERGLVRFNGIEFKTFAGEGFPGALQRRVLELVCDSSGRLWITTVEPGVICYENGRFQPLFAPGELRGANIVRLTETSGGSSVGVAQWGERRVFVQLRSSGRFEPVPGLPDSSGVGDLIGIAEAPPGGFWLQNRARQLFRTGDGDGPRPVELEGGEQPAGELFRMRDGRLAVATGSGVFALDQGSETWKRFLTFQRGVPLHHRIATTVEGDEGIVWMQSVARSPLVALPGGELKQLDLAATGSSFSIANTFFLDRQRNLWVGTMNGLFRLRYSAFTSWGRISGLPANRVISIAEDGDGTIWFAGVGSLGSLGRGAARVTGHPRKPGFHQYIAAGCPTGGVWLSDARGLLHLFEGQGATPYGLPVRPGRGTTQRVGMCTGGDGAVWMGTHAGLFRLDPNELSPRLEPYRFGDSFGQTHFIAPTRSLEGDVYVAVGGDGVFRVSVTSPPQRVTPAGDPVGTSARMMAFDDTGGLWAVSVRERQLGHWGGGAPVRSPLDEIGFDGRAVTGIATDPLGGVWFMTGTDGVARADGISLLAAMESGARPPDLLSWFGRPDGLPTVSCSFAPGGILRASDGRIWVATSDGAAVADPRRVLHQIGAQREQRVPLHLEGVSVEGVASGLSMRGDAPVVVAPGTKSVTFRFASLDLRSPEDRRYRHRLVGLDDAWSEADDRNTATFLAIPAGDYRFEVTSVDPHGQPAPPSASVGLVVQPAWYERKSVRAGGVLGAVGLLWLAFARRLALARQRQSMVEKFSRQLIASGEQERKRIASELHDSLGQDLLLIKNSTEMSLMGIGHEGTQEERLQEISTLASHAIAEVRTVIDNLRPPELDRIGLNAAVETMAANVTGHTGVKVTADLAELPAAWLREHDIALYRITQEAVNNAVKHASATGITVRTALREGQVALEISDDGDGFDPASGSATAGNGLANLRERAALLGGTMQLRSAPGAGTRISFTFPATQ